ncbi:MAG: alpha/beta fold hydrolase [Haloarculaceae archaeon]
MGKLRDAIASRLGGRAGSLSIEPAAETSVVELAEEIAEHPETVELPDGRRLGYADVGDPDGAPLVLHHGFPNSRVFAALFDEIGRERGVRVLAPERPGVGVSDPDPDRHLADFAGDVGSLADTLGVDTFAVLGVSAGSPYALATAAELPDRVQRVGVVAGLAPMGSVGLRERLWYYGARFVPAGTKLALYLSLRRARLDREAFLEGLAEDAAPADRALWTDETGRVIHASMLEARRVNGLDPLVRETALFGSPWGVDLEAIAVPVYLWYGKADTIVPPAMGTYLARTIPTAEAHFYPDLGHLSTVADNEGRIFETLAGGD